VPVSDPDVTPDVGAHAVLSDASSKQLQRVRIQRALIAAAKAGAFFAITYASGVPNQVDPSTATSIPPSSVLCNEIPSTAFDVDPKQGRRLARRRTTWNFELLCRWDVEVSLETFEQSLLDRPFTLPPDNANRLGQVRLNLLRSEPSHPVFGKPSVGTLCKFFFQAETGWT